MDGTTGRRSIGARLAGLLRRPNTLLPEQPFRVTVLLTPDRLPPGTNAGQATVALRRAILSLPGAEYLHVQPRPFISRQEVWLSVSPPGSEGVMPRGRAWLQHHAMIEHLVLETLAGLAVPSSQAACEAPAPLPDVPAPLDFAEAALPLMALPRPAKRPPGRPRRSVRSAPAGEPSAPEAALPAGLALLGQLAATATTSLAPTPSEAARSQAVPQGEPPSDQAFLATLLGLAGRGDTDGLAAALPARHGDFGAVLALAPRELLAEQGMNQHTAAGIKLVHGAALRLARAEAMRRPILSDRTALLAYLTAVLAWERIEHFHILFLDAEHQLLADETQARGTVNHTPVYPREVAKRALQLETASLILVHNRPSGDPSPSQEDVDMTALVRRAAAVVGVAIQDHLIVGRGRSFSFRDTGLLDG